MDKWLLSCAGVLSLTACNTPEWGKNLPEMPKFTFQNEVRAETTVNRDIRLPQPLKVTVPVKIVWLQGTKFSINIWVRGVPDGVVLSYPETVTGDRFDVEVTVPSSVPYGEYMLTIVGQGENNVIGLEHKVNVFPAVGEPLPLNKVVD